MRISVLTLIAVLVTLASCKKEEQTFTISGEIASGTNSTLYLERMGLDQTELLDSIVLNQTGKFTFTKSNGGENPEFYRLRIKDQFIPFIVDSIEHITLKGSINEFGEYYHFEGMTYGLNLQEVEHITNSLSERIVRYERRAHLGAMSYQEMKDSIQENIQLAKGILRAKIAINPQSPVSYYILYKQLFGSNLFDINDPNDQKLFGAVATNYEINYPGTQRAEHLKNAFLVALKTRKEANRTEEKIEQMVTNIESKGNFEINLPNNKGEMIKLSSTQGKVTLLCFTALQTDYSAALTAHLGEIYTSFAGKPFEIYQVCFDSDDNFWRNSASNLPWLTVRDEKIMNSNLIPLYNIQRLPTLYIIDKKGDIVKRIDQIEEIEPQVKKLL